MDKVVFHLRAALAQAIDDGAIHRPDLHQALQVVSPGLDTPSLDPKALSRILITTRRGHGYLLALPATEVRLVTL